MLSAAFASILRSGRADFNAQFASARRQYPELSGELFSAFLEEHVDPLVQAVSATTPTRTADVAMAAYQIALDLVGQRLAGANARHPFINAGWQSVLPVALSHVAEAPSRVLTALSNALHHLATTEGARPEQWLVEMQRLAELASDAETFLRVGQVAAWRAGLAHYRPSALAAADALPESLALAVLNAQGSWSEINARLKADPWFDPARVQPSAHVAGCIGAFSGFGGLFSEPPRVARSGDYLIAISGTDGFLLTADAFGATFHRASAEELAAAQPQAKLPAGAHVRANRLEWKGAPIEAPTCGEITSFANHGPTLALTSALTHSIVLVSLTEGG